jgi:hypothetical protein
MELSKKERTRVEENTGHQFVMADDDLPALIQFYSEWKSITGGDTMGKSGHRYKYSEDCPQSDRRIYCSLNNRAGYFSFEIRPTEKLAAALEAQRCDKRDSVHLEFREWEDDKQYLLTMQNSLILGGRWLNVYSRKEVESFFGIEKEIKTRLKESAERTAQEEKDRKGCFEHFSMGSHSALDALIWDKYGYWCERGDPPEWAEFALLEIPAILRNLKPARIKGKLNHSGNMGNYGEIGNYVVWDAANPKVPKDRTYYQGAKSFGQSSLDRKLAQKYHENAVKALLYYKKTGRAVDDGNGRAEVGYKNGLKTKVPRITEVEK